MELYIENMVCDRCIMAVENLLRKAGYTLVDVRLGAAEIAETPDTGQLDELAARLDELGFRLLRDRDSRITDAAKTALLRLARSEGAERVRLSAWLPGQVGVDYRTISQIFSTREGRTLESFFLSQKIEYVKELLDYGQLTASEIAWRTGYSSVAHLSRQFRAVTGMTMTQYREEGSRRPLDKV